MDGYVCVCVCVCICARVCVYLCARGWCGSMRRASATGAELFEPRDSSSRPSKTAKHVTRVLAIGKVSPVRLLSFGPPYSPLLIANVCAAKFRGFRAKIRGRVAYVFPYPSSIMLLPISSCLIPTSDASRITAGINSTIAVIVVCATHIVTSWHQSGESIESNRRSGEAVTLKVHVASGTCQISGEGGN